MRAPKCANCGELMLETFTKGGLRIYLCPHLPTRKIRDASRKIYTAEIYCHIDIEGLKTSFNTMVKNRKSKTRIEDLREATCETVSDGTLYENANLAMKLGVPANELPAIFEATYRLSRSLGIDISYGITSLCKGIARKRMVILDNIGITFIVNDAYTWYRLKNDLHEDTKLTEQQRDEAWKLYAIKTIKEKARIL